MEALVHRTKHMAPPATIPIPITPPTTNHHQPPPTTDQVGNDRGTQYRHGIYYHDEVQRAVAEEALSRQARFTEVKTEIKPASKWYDGEDYHQQYLQKGGQSAKKEAGETIRCYG